MSQLVLDRTGWTYFGLFIVWNILLGAGMVFLWINRQLPSLRMRRIPLLLAGIFALHTYGAFCVIAYPIYPSVSCNFEFWLMSLWVPFGIALFQASNSQFLHLASRQKQFARGSIVRGHRVINEEKAQAIANSRWRRILAGVERADNINRTLIFIGVGLVVELFLTIFVFFGSKKFHPGYGLFDYTIRGTGMEARMRCSKGWEWWLSIVWQFFWSWIYAPYLLWKSRSIRDVHGWRLQTICCCIAGLPASPLWLASMYIPQFAPVSAYIPPPTWFSICIFFMEIFAVGFPIYDVIRSNTLRQETLDAIANWEKRQAAQGMDGSSLSPSGWSHSTTLKSAEEGTVTSKTSFESTKSAMLTMTALENALRTNATPLLEFAALKDFSGENVSFLTHVMDLRRYWFTPKRSTVEHRRQQFVAATHIYAQYISLGFAEFPINISSREMKRLYQVFEGAATLLYGNKRGSISSASSDNATPFDTAVLPDNASDAPINIKSYSSINLEAESSINLDSLGRANLRAASRLHETRIDDDVLEDFEIPETFNEMVFDAAESEIKYLILTNTWPKFVSAGRISSQMSRDEDEERGNRWVQKVLCSS